VALLPFVHSSVIIDGPALTRHSHAKIAVSMGLTLGVSWCCQTMHLDKCITTCICYYTVGLFSLL
jgi:hypothetical protein